MSWGNFKAIMLGRRKRSVPDGVTLSCPSCQKTLFRKDLEANLFLCTHCDHHHAMPVQARARMLLDEGSMKELFRGLVAGDPLEFQGARSYKVRLEAARRETGLEDAAQCHAGAIEGRPVLLVCTDSRFLMGSMGSVVGEKITRAFVEGKARGCPVIIVSGGGGGARMDEGVFSLMQMVKTCDALYDFQAAGGLYISVLTNPTMGGVMASYASLGDIIVAEPKALIGFTGPRVIKQTIQQDLPPRFQESEFLLEHGQIDRIMNRKVMKAELATLVSFLGPAGGRAPGAPAKPATETAKP